MAPVEPFEQLLHSEGAHPYRRQFDGERQPVQPAAQGGHRVLVVRGEREPRQYGGGPVGEEGQRRVLQRGLRRQRLARCRSRQRLYFQDMLGGHVQRMSAGGEHPHPVGLREQRLDEPGARVRQVFAVIEDEQRFPVLELVDEDPHR